MAGAGEFSEFVIVKQCDATAPEATDTSLVDQSGTEASSRMFVGNLTLDSQASVQTGFAGGVRVGCGDVNGDAFDFSQLTTEPTTSAGKHVGDLSITMYLDSATQPQLTTEPTAPADERSGPSVSEIVVTKVTDSTSPLSEDNHDALRIIKLVDADTDSQPELTTEPTAPEAGGAADDAAGDLQASMGFAPDAFDFTTEPTAPEAYKMQTVFTTHIALVDASSGVTGHTPEWTNFRSSDPGTPHVGLPEVPGDDFIIFDCKPTESLAVDPNNPNVDLPKGDWIADVTYDSVEVLGQPTVAMETLTTAHEGFLI